MTPTCPDIFYNPFLISDAYEAAYSNKCPSGVPAFSTKGNDRSIPFFGASCEELTCPAGYECTQINQLFAKCCAYAAISGNDNPANGTTTLSGNDVTVEQSRDGNT